MKKYYSLFLFLFLFSSLQTINAQVKDGDLIKGTKEHIYLVVEGKACWIPNMDVLTGLKLDPNSAKAMDDAKLNKLPKGWLVFKSESKKYYLNINGNAALIGDSLTFVATGISEKYLFPLQEKVISKLPSVPFIVKGKAAAKFLLVNGKVCPIPSDKIFKALGFDPASVTTINDKGIASLLKASLLVKGEGDKIYLIEKTNAAGLLPRKYLKRMVTTGMRFIIQQIKL
jgi:hypothetical protein